MMFGYQRSFKGLISNFAVSSGAEINGILRRDFKPTTLFVQVNGVACTLNTFKYNPVLRFDFVVMLNQTHTQLHWLKILSHQGVSNVMTQGTVFA